MANTNNSGGNYGNDGNGDDFHAEKTVMMGAEARAALARAMLHVDAGPDKGFSFPVAGATTTVGRGSSCDIVLNDQHVSRQHFRLEMRGGNVVLIDSGSGNGTLVDGQKATEIVLRDGATIQLGGTTLRFATKGGAAGAAASAPAAAAPRSQPQQPAATTQKAAPPKTSAAAAPQKGRGGLIAVLLIVVLVAGAALAAAGDLVFGWWSIPKLRTIVPASWVKVGSSSSSTASTSSSGSDCEEYIKKTCELAGGNETACTAARTAAANLTADQCKMALSAMGGVGAGAADSEECKEYIQKTCDLAGGNEMACAAAKTSAANMTAEQCKLAVSAMAGAAVPAGGAGDSEECKEYVQKTCDLAGGNETACAAAKTSAANMTVEQCKLALSAMAGAAVPTGGAPDSPECQEYIKKTCELAQGNETACAAAKTAAAAMTVEQCKMATSAMAGAAVPTGGAPDSPECQEYIKKTCELAQGNETACAAAKTAAAAMTVEQCQLATSAMAGAAVPTGGAPDSPECQEYIKKTCELALGNEQACTAVKTAAAAMTVEQCKVAVAALANTAVPTGGAPDSPECQEYIKKTCDLAQGNETACAAAKTAAAAMTVEQCKMATSAMAGAAVPTGGAPDSPECQEYIKKTCDLAQGNEQACTAVKTAAAAMTVEQCKVAVAALANTAVPPAGGNAAPECEDYIKKMCERAKGNAIACTAARTATQRMTPEQCKIAASAL